MTVNRGTPGDDYLIGGAGVDFLQGGNGNDRLFGRANGDRLVGNLGNDTLDGGLGGDNLAGGYGNDSLLGGVNSDRLAGNSGNDTLVGGWGKDSLYGGAGVDVLWGGNGSDRLFGGMGNDRLTGSFGFDSLKGGSGIDSLFGGPGADRLLGEAGKDLLFGGMGNDELVGGAGNDFLRGGPGADRFSFSILSADIDAIVDFAEGDKIVINADGFWGATAATQFSYNNATGALSFDLSPADELAPLQFASLPKNLGRIFDPAEDIILVNGDEAVDTPVAATAKPDLDSGQTLPIGATVFFGKEPIGLEVAKTSQQRSLGLMHRESLAPNRGMLFAYDTPRYTRFWMQNVVIPLDMIFLRDGEIQAIYSEVPPCTTSSCPTYGPSTLIDSVIELRGGTATALELTVGDRVEIHFL